MIGCSRHCHCPFHHCCCRCHPYCNCHCCCNCCCCYCHCQVLDLPWLEMGGVRFEKVRRLGEGARGRGERDALVRETKWIMQQDAGWFAGCWVLGASRCGCCVRHLACALVPVCARVPACARPPPALATRLRRTRHL